MHEHRHSLCRVQYRSTTASTVTLLCAQHVGVITTLVVGCMIPTWKRYTLVTQLLEFAQPSNVSPGT